MMRILFLGTSSLDDPSPRGRWLPVARELTEQGHEVSLLLLHPTLDNVTSRRVRVSGVDIEYVGQMHVYGYPGQRRYFRPLELLSVSLKSSAALAVRAVQLRPDVIHIAKPQPINGLAGALASRILRQPWFVDCDDYEAEANRFGGQWQRWVVRWWENYLPLRAQAVSVNTRFLYHRCQALGVSPERLFYVPNGVSQLHYRRPNEERLKALRMALGLDGHPTVVYLGTMSTVAHGVQLLLESFALVLQRLPGARLVMVGDGDDRSALQDAARQLGIEAALRWIGRVPAEAARAYLALADCSVDPVYDTPAARGRSPLKIVESLAVGVPVVAGDTGDRREMLADGAAGVLVRPGDAAHLADGLQMLLTERSAHQRLAEGARRQGARFNWEALARCWATMYH